MEYNYNGEYEKIVIQSKGILDDAKDKYKEMSKKYNEETLQVEAGALIRRTNEELLNIKRTFLQQAQEGLQVNKNTILENRDLAHQSKTIQDKILDQLIQANIIQQLESQLVLASNTNEVLQILDDITDPTVFNVVKAKAYTLVAEQNDKLAIKNKKYHDPQLDEIENAMAQVQYMERDFLSPILPLGVDSIESYITGVNISDYYFGGVK